MEGPSKCLCGRWSVWEDHVWDIMVIGLCRMTNCGVIVVLGLYERTKYEGIMIIRKGPSGCNYGYWS